MGIKSKTQKRIINMKFTTAILVSSVSSAWVYTDPFGVTIADNEMDNVDCSNYRGICTREYNPVCASNGQSYGNPCQFLTKYCTSDSALRFVNWGECLVNDVAQVHEVVEAEEEIFDCPIFCDKRLKPVCASDGTTFNNRCEFEVAVCKRSKNAEAELTLISTGPCTGSQILVDNSPNCPRNCIRRVFRPLCASDGETYDNKCFLDKKNCNDNTDVKQLHKGECK